MPHMRTADAVIESLIRHGIDTLYALPGVHNDHLFDAAHRQQGRFRVLHPRHEQTAAYMALGAALVTGRPQAFAVVPGPGVLNASAALLTAYGMGAPVIALVGQIPSFAIDRGHGHLHEIHDQLGLLRHITKHAARIRGAARGAGTGGGGVCASHARPAAAGGAGMCDRHLGRDRRGRVPRQRRTRACRRRSPMRRTRAATILGQAERPLIVVGGGALDAGAEVQAVAEMLEAPVSSFRRGPRRHPDDASARRSFTAGTRCGGRRCRAGDRHAASSAADELGRRRDAASSRLDIDPRRSTLPPSRVCTAGRRGDGAARAARRAAGARPCAPARAELAAVRAGFAERRAARSRRWVPARDPCGAAGGRHLRRGGRAGRLRRAAGVPGAWPRTFLSRAIRTRSAGAMAPRSARRRRRRGARWCWRPATAVHVPGRGACDRDAPPAAGRGRWCSTMARSATCGGSRSSNTATG